MIKFPISFSFYINNKLLLCNCSWVALLSTWDLSKMFLKHILLWDYVFLTSHSPFSIQIIGLKISAGPCCWSCLGSEALTLSLHCFTDCHSETNVKTLVSRPSASLEKYIMWKYVVPADLSWIQNMIHDFLRFRKFGIIKGVNITPTSYWDLWIIMCSFNIFTTFHFLLLINTDFD